jgi:protein-S-isoprenylcysteine O-methyltransferase Ste14
MHRLDTRVPPPLVAAAAAALMWGLARWWPLATFEVPGAPLWGTAVAVAGVLVVTAGGYEFRAAGTTFNPLRPQRASVVVTSGIYRVTRNPMYLGLLLVLVGWLVALEAATPLVGPVLFASYIGRFQIAPEERALTAKFGDEYRSYMARVRRWL